MSSSGADLLNQPRSEFIRRWRARSNVARGSVPVESGIPGRNFGGTFPKMGVRGECVARGEFRWGDRKGTKGMDWASPRQCQNVRREPRMAPPHPAAHVCMVHANPRQCPARAHDRRPRQPQLRQHPCAGFGRRLSPDPLADSDLRDGLCCHSHARSARASTSVKVVTLAQPASEGPWGPDSEDSGSLFGAPVSAAAPSWWRLGHRPGGSSAEDRWGPRILRGQVAKDLAGIGLPGGGRTPLPPAPRALAEPPDGFRCRGRAPPGRLAASSAMVPLAMDLPSPSSRVLGGRLRPILCGAPLPFGPSCGSSDGAVPAKVAPSARDR